MPFFSIISPVFNTAPYLESFLDSVLSQSFSDFELILVDDGSTDGSREICARRQKDDLRVRVFSQKNAGAGPARNAGISLAKGTYILFFDSDDWIEPDSLKTLHRELTNSPVDLLIYGSREFRYNERETLVGSFDCPPIMKDLSSKEACRASFCELLFSSAINVPWNKVFRRDLICENGIIFPDTRRAQDAFFNMEYYRHIHTLRTIPALLYCYRSNTQTKVWKKFPRDLYLIDVKYDAYLVDRVKEFDIKEGQGKEKIDALFYHSIFRTIGFYKNPFWNLSKKEKIAYAEEILSHPYNQQRAKDTPALDAHTQKIRELILSCDGKAALRYFEKEARRSALYDWYVKTIRPIFKKNS